MARRKRKEKVMGITKKGPMRLRKITRLYYEKNTKAAGFYFFESYHYCINLAAEEPRKIIYLIRPQKR